MADHVLAASANLEAMDAAPTYQAAMTRLVVESMANVRGQVLDFGAGTGTYTRAVAQRCPNWKVRVLEPNADLHSHYNSAIPVHSDLAEIEMGSLDGAYSLNVFEHIKDDVAALRQLASRCKSGSSIFILVPAHMSLWTPMDDLVGHVRRYSLAELEQFAREAGLQVRRGGWFDATGYLATLAYQQAVRFGLLAKPDGSITPTQVATFDRIFKILEPALMCTKVPLGKNCWVLLEKVAET